MKINANISWIVPNIRILAVLPGVIPLSEREGIMDAEDTCLPWACPLVTYNTTMHSREKPSLSHTTHCTLEKVPQVPLCQKYHHIASSGVQIDGTLGDTSASYIS